MWLWNWLKPVVSWIKKAFQVAKNRGLTDEIVAEALRFVQQVEMLLTDNAARREWAVGQLLIRGVPESIARLAVELAVQLWKETREETRETH